METMDRLWIAAISAVFTCLVILGCVVLNEALSETPAEQCVERGRVAWQTPDGENVCMPRSVLLR